MQKKSKIIIISVVTAILLIVGIFTAIALTGADNSVQAVATEKLSLGQKFLLDLEYDKAVAEFQAVIDIEPKNVDAYIGLADAYIGMGDEEKAIEALEKGLSETGDETIRAKLDEMKTPEETTAEVTTTPEVTTTEAILKDDRISIITAEVIDEEERTILAVIEYNLYTCEQGEINVGLPIDDNTYRIIEKEIVNKGAGKVEIVFNVPDDFGELKDNTCHVNLSEYPHPDSWSPLCDDRLTII